MTHFVAFIFVQPGSYFCNFGHYFCGYNKIVLTELSSLNNTKSNLISLEQKMYFESPIRICQPTLGAHSFLVQRGIIYYVLFSNVFLDNLACYALIMFLALVETSFHPPASEKCLGFLCIC